MFAKVFIISSLLAAANCGVIQPVAYSDSHPAYSYSYDVQDSITGDSKSQQETRNGDTVQGSYSVLDPDGTRRTVHYTADDQHGFNAVVTKEPAGVVATPVVSANPVVEARVATPVAYAATGPVISAKYASAPVTYAANPVRYATPLTYSASPYAYSNGHISSGYPAHVSYTPQVYSVAKAAPAFTYSAPLTYAAGPHYVAKTAPLTYSSPAYATAPVAYTSPVAW